jgi:hypothetical protein
VSDNLYAILARPAEPDDDNREPRPSPDKRDPHTVHTASVETIDNDRASYLLGGITL